MLAIEYVDGYKVGHHKQMPEETVYQYNNFTPRKTRRDKVKKVLWFGLQYFIKKYLIEEFNDKFFLLPKEYVVEQYLRRIKNYLPPGSEISTKHLEDLHDLGFLPIRIKALEEGSRVSYKVPPVTIDNTIDGYAWLVGYLETIFSTTVWGPCTSATTAFEYRKLLTGFAMDTVGNDEFVKYQSHDFSMRGMFGLEAAQMSAAGHLLCFYGSDTIPAIGWLEQYYNANCEKEIVATSVDATEHSVMCIGTGLYIYDKADGDWSKIGDAEFSVFKRLITEVYPNGIISIVSDTFNLWTVLNDFLPRLNQEIMARNGKVVIRPDSGNPVDILCGKLRPQKNMIEEDITIPEEDLEYFTENPEDYLMEEWDITDGLPSFSFDADCPVEAVEGAIFYVTINNELYSFEHQRGGCSEARWDGVYFYSEIANVTKVSMEEIPLSTEELGVVESLWNTFGGTITSKGYKLLDPHIGCIYGDSITVSRAEQICNRLKAKGFASINWVAGIGSFTYQYTTRDTDGWAMKATYAEAISKEDGTRLSIPIFKKPITDDGTKVSAKGLMQVTRLQRTNLSTGEITGENFVMQDEVSKEKERSSALEVVFKDGKLVREQSLSGIRRKIDRAIKFD